LILALQNFQNKLFFPNLQKCFPSVIPLVPSAQARRYVRTLFELEKQTEKDAAVDLNKYTLKIYFKSFEEFPYFFLSLNFGLNCRSVVSVISSQIVPLL